MHFIPNEIVTSLLWRRDKIWKYCTGYSSEIFIWRIGNPWSLCHLCLWSHCLATIFVKKVISIVHDTFTVIWRSKCQAFFSLINVIKKFNFLCKLTNLTLSILTPATFLNIVVIHSYIGISIWINRLAFSKIWYWISWIFSLLSDVWIVCEFWIC